MLKKNPPNSPFSFKKAFFFSFLKKECFYATSEALYGGSFPKFQKEGLPKPVYNHREGPVPGRHTLTSLSGGTVNQTPQMTLGVGSDYMVHKSGP